MKLHFNFNPQRLKYLIWKANIPPLLSSLLTSSLTGKNRHGSLLKPRPALQQSYGSRTILVSPLSFYFLINMYLEAQDLFGKLCHKCRISQCFSSTQHSKQILIMQGIMYSPPVVSENKSQQDGRDPEVHWKVHVLSWRDLFFPYWPTDYTLSRLLYGYLPKSWQSSKLPLVNDFVTSVEKKCSLSFMCCVATYHLLTPSSIPVTLSEQTTFGMICYWGGQWNILQHSKEPYNNILLLRGL